MGNEELQDQGENVDVEVTKDESVNDLSEIKNQIKAELEADFMKREAEYKQKISKLDKVITEKDREKLSEVERMKAERDDIEREKEALKKEADEFRRKLAIDSALSEAGLPLSWAKRVIGSTEEEIREDVKGFKEDFFGHVNKSSEAQVAEALKGKAPGRQDTGTSTEREKLIAQYNEAEKNGKGDLMLALKDQIRKLPK